MKKVLCAAALTGLLSASGHTMPFWDCDPSLTNRAADVEASAPLVPFASWEFQDASGIISDFTSFKLGFLLFLR